MKENFKIIFCLGVIFLSSFFVLGLFLDAYSQGLLTTEKNIINVGGIINQNPKQVTLDVIQNVLGDAQTDNVNINKLGFRGAEFTEIKSNDTFRIILIGGSQMFGTGATSDNTTIPGYLNNYIQNNNYPFTVEVINSGLKGVDTHKELLLLENMLLDFSPDLVIVYDGLNDLRAGNSPRYVLDNWNSMCELGKQNNFSVMITLQPIAGFGGKSLTQEELSYIQNGKDYKNNPLIDSSNHYEMFANNLQKLQNCTNEIDLRSVFDNESESVYIDEAHVSDKGNSIVAKSLIPHILSNIPEKLIQHQSIKMNTPKEDSDKYLEFEYIFVNLFSNFEERLLLTSFSIFKNSDFTQEPIKFETITTKTQSQFEENNEISIIIEILSQNEFTNNKIIKITTMDEADDSIIHNVTYLMTITKNGNELFTNYFFAKDELFIQVNPDTDDDIKISGERRYELDALIADSDVPIIISGSFFDLDSTYEFDISLRTIHDSENYIFLNEFYAKIMT
jgi:hypothetical protein|tara:strand:+ start:309 stop:1823 length:1515 start_codon:yes stop_codon:yes gene_type:complete